MYVPALLSDRPNVYTGSIASSGERFLATNATLANIELIPTGRAVTILKASTLKASTRTMTICDAPRHCLWSTVPGRSVVHKWANAVGVPSRL